MNKKAGVDQQHRPGHQRCYAQFNGRKRRIRILLWPAAGKLKVIIFNYPFVTARDIPGDSLINEMLPMAYTRKIKENRVLYCLVFYLLIAGFGLNAYYGEPMLALVSLLGIYQVGYRDALLQLSITDRGLHITRFYFGCLVTRKHDLALDRLMWHPPSPEQHAAAGGKPPAIEVKAGDLPDVHPLPSETHIIYYPGNFPERKLAKVEITHYEALLLLDLFRATLPAEQPAGNAALPGHTGPDQTANPNA